MLGVISVTDSDNHRYRPNLAGDVTSSSNSKTLSKSEGDLCTRFVAFIESVGSAFYDHVVAPVKRSISTRTDDARCTFAEKLNSVGNVYTPPVSGQATPVAVPAVAGVDSASQIDAACQSRSSLASSTVAASTSPISTQIIASLTSSTTFLSKEDLHLMLEKMADQIEIDDVQLADQLRTLNKKLENGGSHLTIKNWATISWQFDAIAIKYLKIHNEYIKNSGVASSVYNEKNRVCEAQWKKYTQAKAAAAARLKIANAGQTFSTEEWNKAINENPDVVNEKNKLDQLRHDLSRHNPQRQQSLMEIILHMKFMSSLAWSSQAYEKIVTRLKEIYDDALLNPAFSKIHSAYVSGSVGVGLDLFGLFSLNFLSGKLKLSGTSIEINDDENFLGHHLLASADTHAKLGTTLEIAGGIFSADLSIEYIQSMAAGQYSECNDVESHVRGWFEELLKTWSADPLIEPWLSRTKIMGCDDDFVMERLTDLEVVQVKNLAEQNRLTFSEIKQRLNIFKGGVDAKDSVSIKKLQKQSYAEELRLENAKTEMQKQKIADEINAHNQKENAILEINAPMVTPFKADEIKEAEILKLNAKVGLTDTPLAADGTVTIKRERLIQTALTYTNYCKFLENQFRPEETKNSLQTLIQRQCQQFKSSLIAAWCNNGTQIRLNRQGVDVLKISADLKISNANFVLWLRENKLSQELLRLRTDHSLKQGKQRWNFIAAHGLTEKKVSELDDVESQFKNLQEDFQLYTKAQQQIARLRNEMSRLRDALSSENTTKLRRAMQQQIDKNNAFCLEIIQRYGATNVEQFLHHVVMFNASLFINAGSTELRKTIREFEEKTLLDPEFKVDIKNWQQRVQVEDETQYEVIDYEVSFNVQCGLENLAGLDGNVTLRFRDRQHRNALRHLDYLELTCGIGVNVGAALFGTISSVLSQADLSAMKQTGDSVFKEMGQLFNNGALGTDWVPEVALDAGYSWQRQVRWYKPHGASVFDFKHILTRHIKKMEIKGDVELPVPTMTPGLTAKLGAGYSYAATDLSSERYTGNSLNPWAMHFMRAYGLELVDLETGDIKTDKQDCFWKQRIEGEQQQGLKELFANSAIENEIKTIADDLMADRYIGVTLEEKRAFRKARQEYIEATEQFQKDQSNYETCLTKLRLLLLGCAPCWMSDKTNASICKALAVTIREGDQWIAVKLAERKEAKKDVRENKKIVIPTVTSLGTLRRLPDEHSYFDPGVTRIEAALWGHCVM